MLALIFAGLMIWFAIDAFKHPQNKLPDLFDDPERTITIKLIITVEQSPDMLPDSSKIIDVPEPPKQLPYCH
jgi:hypothetical protein